MLWNDYAQEAGGRLTDFDGRPTIYSATVLASNGRLHDAALALLTGRASWRSTVAGTTARFLHGRGRERLSA